MIAIGALQHGRRFPQDVNAFARDTETAMISLGQRPLFQLALAVAGMLLLVTPVSARAQIGSLAKRAAAKVASKAADRTAMGTDAPQFDDTMLELTDDRVSAVLAGWSAAQATKGPDGSTRAQLLDRARIASTRRDALLTGRDDDLRRYDDDTRRVHECTQSVLDSLSTVHNDAMVTKGRALAASGDPMNSSIMQDVMKATMESQRLLAAGDTTGAIQVQRDLMKKQGIDPGKDSTVARTRCGALPAKAQWHLQADSLLVIANFAMRQAQDLDRQAASAGAKAAGMTSQQFAVARERVRAFAAADGKPARIWRYSATERQVMLARIDQLQSID